MTIAFRSAPSELSLSSTDEMLLESINLIPYLTF